MACVTSLWRSYGTSVSTSLAALNAPAAFCGVLPMAIPGWEFAGVVAVSFFFVVTFQPRASTLPTWSAAVTAARQRRMSTPACSTKGLFSPGVLVGARRTPASA